jgi:hypothetical protein
MQAMAKKKNRKKHQFKYGHEAANASQAQQVPEQGKDLSAQTKAQAAEAFAVPGYIRGDLVKVATLGSLFIVGQLVLWFIFNRTGLEEQVYRLIEL